ncbi:hypothetical protein EIP91_012408 [Steccherinum ochraceum]|uniref:Uncharacterized protein n=1 Tax=Steccherinum ochraceum TaxID=92696 RepID=A0A4R0RIZ4_9APHY|nr:hypothetical protein EIP91_012408 [Steccherinum ochraceum]
MGELILQLRLYALYFLDKRVLALMGITFLAAVTASTVLMATSLSKIVAVAHLIPGMPFCIPVGLPRTFYAFWIPILISETLLCGLALWRGLQNYFARTVYGSGQRLMDILIRDSFSYFIILFAVYLCNTVIFITGTPAQLESAIGYSVAMSCVMGNRLCLNVRGMLQSNQDLLHGGPKISLEFARHPEGIVRPGSRGSILIIAGSAGTVLTDIEMDELRHMRAARVVHI